MHIALLGDSIFDNSPYLKSGQPDVIGQLKELIPNSTLKAIDGSIISEVASQVASLPKDVTHIVVSVGGNDCLQAGDILTSSAGYVGEALLQLDKIIQRFRSDYDAMLLTLLSLNLPLTICTIYEPQYSEAVKQRVLVTALRLFNDIILSAAIREGLPVIDLRVVCSKLEDFANPIEPSMIGGEKIVERIAWVVKKHNFSDKNCTIYS
jgi:lysophospholipase L1-like esterase